MPDSSHQPIQIRISGRMAPAIAAVSGLATAWAPLAWAPLALTQLALELVHSEAQAQPADQGQAGQGQAQPERTPREAIEDFIHFVRIARVDIAAGLAGELGALPITDSEFADLVDGVNVGEAFDTAVAQALFYPELEGPAAALAQRYERGRLDRARNAEEIRRNIEVLRVGTLYARTRATERLLSAGEYAMPQLLESMLRETDTVLVSRVEDVIVGMGPQALVPLMTLIGALDAGQQELLVALFRRIGYATPLPVLVDLHRTTASEELRRAIDLAVRELGGSVEDDPAGLYRLLAEGYYKERPELTSFPGETVQLLWDVVGGGVPTFSAIRTEVFHEAMAMRYVQRAIELAPTDQASIALWIAANLSREIDLPAGYEDPSYPPSRRDATFYSVAAGPQIGGAVLRRAIDDRDTPLARRAIATIERTAGAAGLTAQGSEGRRPLVEALTYPNRRVRYEASLAFAAANPRSTFVGAETVVPTLAAMVRESGDRYAVVLTGSDREAYDRLRVILEGDGFVVLPPADNGLGDIETAIYEAPGIDLVVIQASLERARGHIDAVRDHARLSVSPVAALVPGSDLAGARLAYQSDPGVEVRRDTIQRDELLATAGALIDVAGGGAITAQDARDYADRALSALRDLALSPDGALRVEEGAVQLLAALGELTGERRQRLGEILSRIAEPSAQVALMDAALDARGPEQVAFLDLTAASAKRFGSLLEARQVRRLVEIVEQEPDDAVATAAAALAGVIELPGSSLAPLILGQPEGIVRRR